MRPNRIAWGIVAATGAVFAIVSSATAQQPAVDPAAADFIAYCASCHGPGGQGDGPVAAELRTPPADLTVLARQDGGTFPEDRVAARIDGRQMPGAHGTSEMPVWGYWFKIDAHGAGILQEDMDTAEADVKARIGRLVRFIATLQAE